MTVNHTNLLILQMDSHLSAIMTNSRGLVNLTGLLDSIPASTTFPWIVRYRINDAVSGASRSTNDHSPTRTGFEPSQTDQSSRCSWDIAPSIGTLHDLQVHRSMLIMIRTTCGVSFQKSLSMSSNQLARTKPVSTKLECLNNNNSCINTQTKAHSNGLKSGDHYKCAFTHYCVNARMISLYNTYLMNTTMIFAR